ncbi:hypothetical protein EYZ11_007800 [Aspergillus tanneri]|uniref:Secreted LysM effector LysM C-terminal domain-containing protein n=1 Tax=Aspergillus tanneri TaxID=1220188 RepID=A0A4S3JC29_9EURO|nr:uncharacterized protein ATNIH1004_009634 [Aspergillus tanneri]KAA8642878.1 hypothetical protein ATNIH1004_009634 [Aspergillus tanneri]THC92723.1 hypothetical protein EYZ11_007800 [Aspergillus tanneri]
MRRDGGEGKHTHYIGHTAIWIVSIDSEEGCTGDHCLTGHNERQLFSYDESSLTYPLSWQLTGTDAGAICTAFNNNSCDNSDGEEQAYMAYKGCINYSKNFDTETWVALKYGI